ADGQRTFVPVPVPGAQRLVLQLREGLDDEKSFSRESLLRAAGVAVAVVLLCSVLTVVLGIVWVGRPIQALCRAAARIGQGDLSTELRLEGRNELTTLAAEMNGMCRSLATARDHL